jgi:hypothetical protein
LKRTILAAAALVLCLVSSSALAQQAPVAATAAPAAPAAPSLDLGTALALKNIVATGQLLLLANDASLAKVPAALERRNNESVCYLPEDTKEKLADGYIAIGNNSLAVLSPRFTNVDYDALIYLRNEFFPLQDKPVCGRLEIIYAYRSDVAAYSAPAAPPKKK